MNPAENKLSEIMDAYERGEVRVVAVALEVSRTLGQCSQEVYERAEKILADVYNGVVK